MYQFTLRDAADSVLRNIAGVCADSDQFIDYVNEAQRRLMRRGSWFEAEQVVKLCIYNGCITWPRFVGTVLGIRFSCLGDVQMRNNWFAIIGPKPSNWGSSALVTVRDAGGGPTYNNITGTDGKLIQANIQHRADIGKKIRIFGLDATTNLPVQEKDADGNWVDGITITLSAQPAYSSVLMRTITSVIKDRTQGYVFLYEFDITTNLMRDLAMYEPSETNPRYRKSKIDNFCATPTQCQEVDGVRQRSIEALVKLEFIPVVTDADWLFVDNVDALKLAIQAIRLEEANDDAAAEGKWIKSIREMNFELRSRSPSNQVTVRINPEGRSILSPI